MTQTLLERPRGNLPAEVTNFIGREAELAEASRLLDGVRLVTLAGVSGVGKTRLALRIAARSRFRDGAWLVELSGLTDPDLLATTVAGVFGLSESSARDPIDMLVDHFGDKRLLLVLDTCEHLINACATLAETLLKSAPGLRILATSRELLDVPGEHILPVQPLTAPDPDGAAGAESDSLALFADRAVAVRPGFQLDERNRRSVTRLCHRLDGIPLAIELAAGRLRALSVQQIVDRLDDRFRLLGSARTSLTRHQTLRAAVGWSHELCTPDERLLWSRLSVFARDFDLESAEGVCADDELPDVCEALTRLVEKSIVLREEHDDELPRYRLLDTIREYGAEQLGDSGPMRRLHCAWFVELARSADDASMSTAQVDWLGRIRREHANLRAAMAYALEHDTDAALALMSSLWVYWGSQGLLIEGSHWMSRVLALDLPPSPRLARALCLGGLLAGLRGELDLARRLEADLRETAAAIGDEEAVAGYVHQAAGQIAFFGGDLATARAEFEEARRRHSGRQPDMEMLLDLLLSAIYALTGEFDLCLERAEDCRRRSEERGERWFLTYALWMRGMVRWMTGDADAAAADAREALRGKLEVGDLLGAVMAIDVLAGCAIARGEPMRGTRLLGATETMWRELGAPMFGPQYLEIRAAAIADVRAALGDDPFEAAFEAGARLDRETACAEALADIPAESPEPLTPRETEIAGLIAEGLSNREIAERLVIAERTTDSYVNHIMTKLGVSSRSQIAIWVARHGVR